MSGRPERRRDVGAPVRAQVRWLDGPPAALAGGAVWGMPWARGTVPAGSTFGLVGSTGAREPLQSWVAATWPDGSVKWTGHAARPERPAPGYQVLAHPPQPTPSSPTPSGESIRVIAGEAELTIDTGVITARIPRQGPDLVAALHHAHHADHAPDRPVAGPVRLVSERATHDAPRRRTRCHGEVEQAVLEQDGPVRAVVLLTGRHTDGDRRWLPFRVRLSFWAGSDQIQMVHTMVWDGDPEVDLLCALGLQVEVPLGGPLHDRHVRIAGSQGFLTEAVRPVTGLWPDPGEPARTAQVAGRATPPTADWQPVTGHRAPPPDWDDALQHVPAWRDWTLAQLSPDGYTLRKRTAPDRAWVPAPGGIRARGYAYLGTPDGGLELGLRHFWQGHPTQLDVRDATTDTGSLTAWLWSPQAPPMDVRFYHHAEHEQTVPDQLDALDLTYEDVQPGMATAHGIARTHELTLRAAPATPDHDTLQARADANAMPPRLVPDPAWLRHTGVFGDWDLPDRTHPAAAEIEDRLEQFVGYYADQVEQRRWYGFWDHGDVMHSYDRDRHTWSYDIGGYAWDNSELSTDLWLWTSYLRTGDPQTFRLAEAMTRHTGEVDVHHTGPHAGFGTRHNVQHWGCSCLLLRVSSAVYRRIPFFLTADERLGDLLDEVTVTDDLLLRLDRLRSIGSRQGVREPDPAAVEVDLGIDLGALLASWLTQWERGGDGAAPARERIERVLTDIAGMPQQWFTGIGYLDLGSGRLAGRGHRYVSHLTAVFGLVEVLSEIFDLLDLPEAERAWASYCRLYLADAQDQLAGIGQVWDGPLKVAHTRLLAWAAHRSADPGLAARAWEIFFTGPGDRLNPSLLDARDAAVRVEGPRVAAPVTEIPGLTTNDAAQWSLAAIQNLALIGDALPHLPTPTKESHP